MIYLNTDWKLKQKWKWKEKKEHFLNCYYYFLLYIYIFGHNLFLNFFSLVFGGKFIFVLRLSFSLLIFSSHFHLYPLLDDFGVTFETLLVTKKLNITNVAISMMQNYLICFCASKKTSRCFIPYKFHYCHFAHSKWLLPKLFLSCILL